MCIKLSPFFKYAIPLSLHVNKSFEKKVLIEIYLRKYYIQQKLNKECRKL